jgi:hypothetical protein
MAGALLIVCAVEWAAGRNEFTSAGPPLAHAPPVHPVVEAQRSEDTEEHDALGWTAFEEAQEPSDAMTIIGVPPREEEPVAKADPEPESEPEPEPEPELPPAAEEQLADEEPRKRWWRRAAKDEIEAEPAAEAPRHVRVLPPEADDPWEQGFDAPVTAEAEEVGDEDADELVEESGRRLFRRR